jgi:hypothetical protein
MAKSTTFSNDLELFIFNATALSDFSGLANVYVSLHTADPGIAGSQLTNETAYTNYGRIAVARSGAGWTVATGSATNAAPVTFTACGVTGATITHVAIGLATSGAGKVFYAGQLNSPLVVVNGIIPAFAAGALTVTES